MLAIQASKSLTEYGEHQDLIQINDMYSNYKLKSMLISCKGRLKSETVRSSRESLFISLLCMPTGPAGKILKRTWYPIHQKSIYPLNLD